MCQALSVLSLFSHAFIGNTAPSSGETYHDSDQVMPSPQPFGVRSPLGRWQGLLIIKVIPGASPQAFGASLGSRYLLKQDKTFTIATLFKTWAGSSLNLFDPY